MVNLSMHQSMNQRRGETSDVIQSNKPKPISSSDSSSGSSFLALLSSPFSTGALSETGAAAPDAGPEAKEVPETRSAM